MPEWPDHIKATIEEAGNMVINIDGKGKKMTKKVLISLDDIENMLNDLKLELLSRDKDADFILKILATMDSISSIYKRWFDFQPDVMPIIQDYEATKNLFKTAIPMLDEGLAKLEITLSKMKATGVKDDN